MKQTYLQDFIDLTRKSFSDFLYNFWILTGFLVFYNLVGLYIIMPFGVYVMNFFTAMIGYGGLNLNNPLILPTDPLFILVGAFVLLFYALYCLFEITTITYCIYESHNRRKVQLIPLILTGLKRALDILRFKNWWAAFYIVVLVPLTHFGITNDFITSINLPNYIMEHIEQVLWEQIVYFVLLTAVVVIVFLTTFTFFYYTLEGGDFLKSFKKSIALIEDHLIRTLFFEIGWFILLALLTAVFYLTGDSVILSLGQLLAEYVEVNGQIGILMSTALGTLSMIYSTYNVVLSTGITALTVSFLCNYFLSFEPKLENSEKSLIIPFQFKIRHQKRIIIPVIVLLSLGIIFTRSRLAWRSINTDAYTVGIQGPQVTAHRGASKQAPENTRSAIELAIEQGADYVEIDVTQTKDNVLVISHDNNLKGRLKIPAIINQSTYEELLTYDFGIHFSPRFAGEKILTLDEAIDICKGRIKMNIELKPYSSDKDLVLQTINTVYKHDLINECVIASTDIPTLFQVESIDPEIRTCFNTSTAFAGVELLPFDVISIEKTFITNENIERIHSIDKQVWVWTCDTREEIALMTEEYVDNIITNNVPLAKQVIKQEVSSLSTENKDLIELYLMRLLFSRKQ